MASDHPTQMDAASMEEALRNPLLRKPRPSERQQGRNAVPILTNSRSDGNWSPNVTDLRVLSFAFLFIFLAYSAVQNLESSLNTDKGLGSAAVGVVYLSLTVSSLVSSTIVIFLGAKNALILGISGYWAFVAANLWPSWYTLIPAAVYLGFTAAVLWVAEGTYLTYAAKRHAAAVDIPEATAIGTFNGEFWGVYQSNQVIGNLLTLALLNHGKGPDDAPSDSSSSATPILFAVFLGSLAIGTVLVFSLRSHYSTHEQETSAVVPAVANPPPARLSFKLLSDKRMLLLLFPLFYAGMQQAFAWGDFTSNVVTPAFGISWVGGVMAAYGFADAFGSYISGKFISGLSSARGILCVGAGCQMVVLVGLFFKSVYGHSQLLNSVIIFVAAVLWGVGDATIHTQFSALFGILYPQDLEAAFALWKIWQSAGTAVIFFASRYFNFNTKLAVLFGALLVSMGLFFMAMIRSPRAS